MELVRPITFVKATICNECGCDSLELYDSHDRPMGVKSYYDNNDTEILSRLNARYFKCTNCGADYPIQWIGNKPIPLTMGTYELFFNRFKILSGNG